MLMHANNLERPNMGKEVMEARTQNQEIAFAPGAPPMASLDMEPLNIMGDWYQIERKPTLEPPQEAEEEKIQYIAVLFRI